MSGKDYTYMPPVGPLPGKSFECQTTQFFNELQEGQKTNSESILSMQKILAQTEALAQTSVQTTGNQTIDGVKTFSSSPVVPDASATGEAVNKGQLDTVDSSAVHKEGEETIIGSKIFNSFPRFDQLIMNNTRTLLQLSGTVWGGTVADAAGLTLWSKTGASVSGAGVPFDLYTGKDTLGDEKHLIGRSNGTLAWNNSKVITGADVFQGGKGPASQNDIILPSGGTWAYLLIVRSVTDGTIYSWDNLTAAGGTNLTNSYAAANYQCKVFAIKIAN